MTTFFVTIHVIASILLIVLVLLQAGKGSSLGAALGGGASNTLFGPSGSGNVLTKITTGLAILFMVTSISLAYMSGKTATGSVMGKVKHEAPVKAATTSENGSNALDKKEASKAE